MSSFIYDKLDPVEPGPNQINTLDSNGHFGAVNGDYHRALRSDMILHQGVLHVIYNEYEWNGSVRVLRGPFVKKYVSGSWTSLGGEVEPSLTPVEYQTAGMTVGQISHPCDVSLVSDGTDLFAVYAAKVCAVAPNAPPAGSMIFYTQTGGGEGSIPYFDAGRPVSNGADQYSLWWPFHAFVRRWNGSSWVLYGDVEPLCFNSRWQSEQSSTRDPSCSFWPTKAYASAGEPGAVYVSFMENGITSSIHTYMNPASYGPDLFFGHQWHGTTHHAGWINRMSVTRFDGSDTVGVTKNLAYGAGAPIAGGTYYNANGIIGPANTASGDFNKGNTSPRVTNEDGTPRVLWRNTLTANTELLDWATLGVLGTRLYGDLIDGTATYDFTIWLPPFYEAATNILWYTSAWRYDEYPVYGIWMVGFDLDTNAVVTNRLDGFANAQMILQYIKEANGNEFAEFYWNGIWDGVDSNSPRATPNWMAYAHTDLCSAGIFNYIPTDPKITESVARGTYRYMIYEGLDSHPMIGLSYDRPFSPSSVVSWRIAVMEVFHRSVIHNDVIHNVVWTYNPLDFTEDMKLLHHQLPIGRNEGNCQRVSQFDLSSVIFRVES